MSSGRNCSAQQAASTTTINRRKCMKAYSQSPFEQKNAQAKPHTTDPVRLVMLSKSRILINTSCSTIVQSQQLSVTGTCPAEQVQWPSQE